MNQLGCLYATEGIYDYFSKEGALSMYIDVIEVFTVYQAMLDIDMPKLFTSLVNRYLIDGKTLIKRILISWCEPKS